MLIIIIIIILCRYIGTIPYLAPELILDHQYTSAVDIWAFGCIMFEVLNMVKSNVPDCSKRRILFPVSDEQDHLSSMFGFMFCFMFCFMFHSYYYLLCFL